MTNVLLEIFLRMETQVWNLHYIPFHCLYIPYYVIEHRHEDNSSLELFGFAHFAHDVLDFVDELQCRESSENFPLEFHRYSVNCVQSSVLW